MYRFLALSWDSSNARASAETRRCLTVLRAARPQWSAVESQGLAVYHDWPVEGPWRAWRLPGDVGVVLGRLFVRGSNDDKYPRAVDIDAGVAQRMAATDGRSLVDQFWGAYVAFLVDRRHHARVVLRSIGAGIACYRLRRASTDVFFSDLADVVALGFGDLDLDRESLIGFLCNSQIGVRRTGLREVTEVLAGECVRIGLASEQREMYWQPRRYCEERRVTETLSDSVTAAERLRSTTQGCIDAWSSVHRQVLLQLSGGLDSAVVLGCLHRCRPRPAVTGVNRYAPFPGEDERRFARAAAGSVGVRLEERECGDADFDLERRLGELPMAPKPSIPALLQIDTRATVELLASTGAESCWTGQGGDHLFYQFETPLMVADALWHRRRFSEVRTVIRDAARLTRKSYWALSALGVQSLVGYESRAQAGSIDHDTSFVAAEIRQRPGVVQEDHPWMTKLREVAPGKRLQICQLIELLQRHAPIAREIPTPEVHPLTSLPLIELCLSLPTWVTLRGGRNRALARMAFADRLPASIRERESKGSTGLFLTGVLRRRAAMIATLLLEGELSREGWVNRPAIERHLVKAQPLRPGQLLSLLACVAAEVWLSARKARQRSYC